MKKVRVKESRNTKEALFLIFLVVMAFIVGIIPGLLYKIRQLIIDLCLGYVTDDGLNALSLLGIFLFTVLIQQITLCIKDRVCESHVIKRSYVLESAVKNKVTRLQYSEIENVRFTALLAEADKLSDNLTAQYSAYFSVCTACVYLAASIYAIVAVSVWLVAAVLCLLGVNVGLNIYCSKKTEGFWAKYMFTTRKANYFSSILTDRQYAQEKKVLGAYNFFQNKFEKEFDVAEASNRDLGRSRLKIEVCAQTASCLFPVAVLLILLFPLLNKTITLGTYCSLFFLLSNAVSLINAACGGVFEIGNARHGLKAVKTLLDLSEENLSPAAGFVPETIEFRNVSFSYPDTDRLILDNVSFKLNLKGKYAIVGENGSGKSTLVKLLLGLYKPDSGSIFLDDVPLENLSRKDINGIFSVVFQNSFEYPLTLKENIFMNNTGACGAEFELTADKIGLNELIDKLPDGMNTDLSLLKQNSTDLSGGEWQKVAIARCLCSSGVMAVLDEPNAALDPLAEMRIYRAYSEILKDRGALLVTHRLGSVKDLEKILVLRNGKTEAFGTHNGLMENCPYYKQLFLTQRSMYYEE